MNSGANARVSWLNDRVLETMNYPNVLKYPVT